MKGERFGGLKVDLMKPLKQHSKHEGDCVVATEKDDTILAGTKRLRLEAFNAVKKGEITNNVEYAFL